jgi:hypothetical protein
MAPRPLLIFQKISPSDSDCTFAEVQSAGFGFNATAAVTLCKRAWAMSGRGAEMGPACSVGQARAFAIEGIVDRWRIS